MISCTGQWFGRDAGKVAGHGSPEILKRALRPKFAAILCCSWLLEDAYTLGEQLGLAV